MEDQEEDGSHKNSAINPKLPDDTQDPKTSVHKQMINTGQNEPDQQEKVCQDSLSRQEAVSSAPRPPPPPPPPALKLPTSQIIQITSKLIWMMKEV